MLSLKLLLVLFLSNLIVILIFGLVLFILFWDKINDSVLLKYVLYLVVNNCLGLVLLFFWLFIFLGVVRFWINVLFGLKMWLLCLLFEIIVVE